MYIENSAMLFKIGAWFWKTTSKWVDKVELLVAKDKCKRSWE